MRPNGHAIRAIREAHGWTPAGLSAACEISRTYLANIEAGRRDGTAELLRKIADTLGVPLAAIVSDFTPAQITAVEDSEVDTERVPA